MSKVLDDLLYSKTHEWVKVEGNIAYVGVTDYAQESLGSVVYVEGFDGENCNQGEDCGAIESVKAASDIKAPVSGLIVEVNDEVVGSPELINNDCYKNWILKIEMDNEDELNELMSAFEYQEFIA